MKKEHSNILHLHTPPQCPDSKKYKKAATVLTCTVLLVGSILTAAAKNLQKTAFQSGDNQNVSESLYQSLISSKKFTEYEKYGLTYDKSCSRLMYDGNVIGYFHDETAPDVYTHIVETDGNLGIRVLRDSNYQITGFDFVER